ncbi:hypothetical protein GCM10027075_12940 [Streptomyces heilongjiangensis]
MAGHRRHIFVPAPAESVPHGAALSQDPPIYRALMRTWADGGRTLPGRHDPEWVRLAAPPSGLGRFGGADPFATSSSYGSSALGFHGPFDGSPADFVSSFSVTRDPRDAGR